MMTEQTRAPDAGPRLRIVTAPAASLYDLPVDAVVEEQDRYRLLGFDGQLPEPAQESFPRLVTEMDAETPAPLGSLLRGGGKPMRLKAILLDIDRGRTVNVEHLREVVDRLCLLVDTAPLKRLGMPLLGCVHGNLAPAVFAAVLAPRIRATRLETLFLLTGSNPGAQTLRQLRAAFNAAE